MGWCVLSPFVQTLYTYPDSFRASKILIAARYSGAEVRVVSEPPEFELGKTNKTEQFLTKFPLGKVGNSHGARGWQLDFNLLVHRFQHLKQLMEHPSLRVMLLHTMVRYLGFTEVPIKSLHALSYLGSCQHNLVTNR